MLAVFLRLALLPLAAAAVMIIGIYIVCRECYITFYSVTYNIYYIYTYTAVYR